MANNTKIEWCDDTGNLWWGCSEVHKGCDECYARELAKRFGYDIWGNDKPRLMIKSVWKELAKQQRVSAKAGVVRTVFIGSMMDIFEKPFYLVDHDGRTITDGIHDYPADTGQLRDQLFDEISEGKYPNLLFLLLTKRPSNINKMIPEAWKTNPPANVMFGTSPVDQKTADTLIPQLLRVNGNKFLSMEPLLGPVDLSEFIMLSDNNYGQEFFEKNGWAYDEWSGGCIRDGNDHVYNPKSGIDWIITGGESGRSARPMHPDWVRSIRDQCEAAGVPFFFKQFGEYTPYQPGTKEVDVWVCEDGRVVTDEYDALEDQLKKSWSGMYRVGKKEAGRELDKCIHDEFPKLE